MQVDDIDNSTIPASLETNRMGQEVKLFPGKPMQL